MLGLRPMGGADTQTRKEPAGLRRRLGRLVAGRLVASAILLGASALWTRLFLADGAPRNTFDVAVRISAAVVLLTAAYVAALRLTRIPLAAQAAAQFFFDILLVTWLVAATGDLHSPYAALYIVIISVASIFLGAREALLTATGCAVFYTAAMLAVALSGTRETTSDAAALAEAVGTIGLNDIGFLIVGLLAARLAERQRSDVQLIEATHALASLRRLHERIVESIRSGVITTDLERRVYTMNRAAEEMTGYTDWDLRGQDVSILFGDIRAQIDESLRAAAAGQASPRFEADCLTAEGFRARLGYSVSPLAAEAGETTGLVITFQDLTDVRAMEETSRRQERLSAVGRVAAGIAHEIRNPLAAMRGSIQVLRDDLGGDPMRAELMEIVLRESDRLNRIITDFLTYARPRPVALAEVDLREPLRETFALLRHSPDVRPDHALEDVSPGEPVMAQADEAAVKQVFWNLARNALHAMPEGGRLRAELSRVPHGRARVTFTDTGRGMSPSQVERLFEPFSSSTTGGTGLGLSIVYQIIRDHGGTINVRSREGHGTTITVELPCASPARRDDTHSEAPSGGGDAR
ncbi:MAG TPA: ATP-binding protein [Pyrinomonadaceae bacterium]|nr:ATP-binding protein [Pyrinomonadaceae bacterium]